MHVDWHTKRPVCIKMRKFIMFITALCVLFLIKLDGPGYGLGFMVQLFCQLPHYKKCLKLQKARMVVDSNFKD